jgi:hypothetical protein
MTFDLSDPIAVLLASVDALGRAGIQVAAYGGLALAAYGTPRETKDADLVVVAATGTEASAAFAAAGVAATLAFDRVRFGGNRVTRLTLLPGTSASDLNTVDLVEPLSPRYAKEVLARAYVGRLRERDLRIVTPEDFVLLKVLSTRERDLEDASAVLATLRGRLDRSFIDEQIRVLTEEISAHDVVGRYQKAVAAV